MDKASKVLLKKQHAILAILLILMAFVRNIESVYGLHYGYDFDSDRDLGSALNMIGGNILGDPSYNSEYIWYNPLISWIDGFLIKLTGLPAITLVTQVGAVLNILAPILFYQMVSYFFNNRVALASLASFLFFSTGNMQGFDAATYSPWFYPVNFMQAVFYLGIMVICKAFIKGGYLYFIFSGIVTGIAFLGHFGPTLLLLSVFCFLIIKELIKKFKMKGFVGTWETLKYGMAFCLSFLMISLPLFYTVFWKYKYQIINTGPSQLMQEIFYTQNFWELFRMNFSIAFVMSLIGLLVFIFKKHGNIVKRNALWVWLCSAFLFFCYILLVPILRISYNIHLHGLLPAHHFFFYLKSFQSVLFGIGFCMLTDLITGRVLKFAKNEKFRNLFLTISILLISVFYYPTYRVRKDFTDQRKTGLERNKLKEEINVYHFLLNQTDIKDVVVCEVSYFSFPVLASGRKQVAAQTQFSNPFISYEARNYDRIIILKAIYEGNVAKASPLMKKYNVKFILLENCKLINLEKLKSALGSPVYEDKKFSIYQNGNMHH